MMRKFWRLARAAAPLVYLATLSVAQPAAAALGGARGDIEADRAHMGAALTSRTASTYTAHTLTLPNGAVANEYLGPDGVVFAVTWHGPSRPDLKQLLGPRFDQMQVDNAPSARRRGRRPLLVNRRDFILRSGGHSGAFWGVAYLRAELPAGFTAGDLSR